MNPSNSEYANIDCIFTRDQSELCYGCLDIAQCYRCQYLQNASGCTDCLFCYNLTNCDHCFGSVNLRNASYYWFNEKVTPEEYERRFVEAQTGSALSIAKISQQFSAS